MNFLHKSLTYWRPVTIILPPIILVPLLTTGTKYQKESFGHSRKIGYEKWLEYAAAYCVFLMAIYWTTEAIPLAVTSLLPIVLFPLLGVMESDSVCKEYFKDTNLLFVGGLIVALSVEECQLHKRIALRMLKIMGSNPKWLMLGFMLVTASLSMWISNTATTAMMVPVAVAVIEEILSESIQADDGDDVITHSDSKLNKYFALAKPADKRIAKTLLLSVCYAANIGGTGALTGTGPNMVFVGQLNSFYPDQDVVTFASWMLMTLPLTIIILFASWILLMIVGGMVTSGSSKSSSNRITKVLEDHYKQLGPLRFEELAMMFWFGILVLLWIFREPKFITGWGSLFRDDYVGDETSAVLIALIVMIFPRNLPNLRSRLPQSAVRLLGYGKTLVISQEISEPTDYSPLVSWKTVQRKLMWDIVILLGGGFALAKGVESSGLSKLISSQLTELAGIPPWAFITIAVVTMTFLTEITSNTATATIIIPLMQAISIDLGLNPIMLMYPVSIAASFAFMLPVATPPNAIVFGTGIIKVKDMAFVGLAMNFVCIILTSLYVNSYVEYVFGLSEVPTWANNITQLNANSSLFADNATVSL